MCGFAVILGASDREIGPSLQRMKHRGNQPWVAVKAGSFRVGHIRLPINGLTSEFDQPYKYKGWTFAFVGEIVNFRDIAPTARSDIEVVAQRIVENGLQSVREFDGFWSIAAIPPNGSPLYIITDFLGKKPVYYRDDRKAFASEIRGLSDLGPVTPDPLYFSSVRKWGYHIGRRTWAEQIKKLPPGSLTIMDNMGQVTIHEDFDKVLPDPSLTLGNEIKRAVKNRVLSSDVPIALLVSGGLDSSIIYKLTKNIRSDIIIYHAENTGDSIDDLGTPSEKTFEVKLCSNEMSPRFVLRWNEGPVDLGSVWPQLSLALQIKESVAISGDGADELFGGYRRALEYDSQGSDVWEELPHYHAPRLDKLMMAGTVELRSPFMGRKVLAGALALPWSKRRDKLWLRHFAESIDIPKKIAYGPKIPLKTDVIRATPLENRRFLCDTYMDMIRRGHT